MRLEFPELGKMQDGLTACCEVGIPESYTDTTPVPLLVWFSGGKGTHRISNVPDIVDLSRFLLVALPYPDGDKPRVAITDDTIDRFWDYQLKMLQRIQSLVPNISKDIRIVGGVSSGAHLVGTGLDSKWEGFVDYFNIFVLHEGGLSKFMSYDGIRASHRVLLSYGEETPCRGFQEYLVERMVGPNRNISVIEIPDTRHELNRPSADAIRRWIDQCMLEISLDAGSRK
jgi:hypothetical protein